MRRGTQHNPESRARIRAKALEVAEAKRRLALVATGEIRALERNRTVAPSMRPFAKQATAEAAAWIDALGGPGRVSPQRRAIIDDAAGRLGLLVRALMARFLQGDHDAELASRIATLCGHRRSALQALGLDRVEVDLEVDLRGYLERAREAAPIGASEVNDSDSEPQDPRDAVVAPAGEETL